jgi:hypothetical protein
MTHPGTRPASVWFLYSEAEEPLGQVYRNVDQATPEKGTRLVGGERSDTLEIVSFQELTSTCAMRRFRVVVRIVDA